MSQITIIDADCILANMLLYRDQVTTRDLNRARGIIETKHPTVYVDVSTGCITKAVRDYPDLFTKHGQVITRRYVWAETLVCDMFNWQIPACIRDSVLTDLIGDSK